VEAVLKLAAVLVQLGVLGSDHIEEELSWQQSFAAMSLVPRQICRSSHSSWISAEMRSSDFSHGG
jgi:hypothetical protein